MTNRIMLLGKQELNPFESDATSIQSIATFTFVMYWEIPSLMHLFRSVHPADENEPLETKETEANLSGTNINHNHHLITSNVCYDTTKQQQHPQRNVYNSEQRFLPQKLINSERSIVHNSNANVVFPYSKQYPNHPMQSKSTIHHHFDNICHDDHHRDLVQLNCDLQRQIEILKQCSNDEIKMLKARLHTLEKRVNETPIQNNHHIPIDDDYKENEQCFIKLNMYKQCTADDQVPTKLCPNILTIIKASQAYNTLLHSNKVYTTHNESHIWSRIRTETRKDYSFASLIDDYTHLLNVHCNHNNIFELRIVYLQLQDILHSRCDLIKRCKCIANIKETPFEPKVLYILDVIHCLLYHGYSNHDQEHRLIDCIMDKNEKIIEYDKSESNVLNLTVDTSIIDQRTNILYAKSCSVSPLSGVKTPHNDLKLVLSAIEMSEDRVRRLSGKMNEEQIKSLIAEYDNEEKIVIENEEESSSTLSENGRAEIADFKSKLDPDKQRRASKHNLMRSQEGNEWDAQTMEQTVQDMKKQLLHLAMTTPQ
eukprot:514893_1